MMQQFQDGQTKTINGATYVRQGGVWQLQQAPQAQSPVTYIQPDQNNPMAVKARNEETRAQQDQVFQQRADQRAQESHEKAMAGGGEGGEDVKLTEGERKSLGFLRRMLTADKQFRANNVGPRGGLGAAADAVLPDFVMNKLDSEERQIYDRALEDFISANLRMESGAVIGADEKADQMKLFFPGAGQDGSNVGAAFEEARKQAIEGMIASAGRGVSGELEAMVNEWRGGGAVDKTSQTVAPNAPGQIEAAGDRKLEADPRLAGANDLIGRMLAEGQGNGQIIKALHGMGVSGAALRDIAGQLNQFRQFQQQHPDSPLPAIDVERRDVPTSAMEQVATAAAMTPLGTGVINAADALSMGTLDNMSGDPEGVRAGMQLSSELNPTAAFAGQVGGAIGGMALGEAALARAGMAGGGLRSLIADGAYGAGYGAGNADDGNRLQGAVGGALLAAGGNLAGQGIAKGIGSAIAPTGGSLKDLYAAGVRPTPGQRGLAASDGTGPKALAGRAINAVEEGLTSVPIVGQAISGARQEARDQFQVGAFKQALDEIDVPLPKGAKPGEGLQRFAKAKFDDIYEKARSGMVLRADDELLADIAPISEAAAGLTDSSQRQFRRVIEDVVVRLGNRDGGQVIKGDAYKKIVSQLGNKAAALRKSKTGDDELAALLLDVQGALENAARRHSPKEAVELMDKADRGYAKLVLIQNAGRKRGGNAGEFTPTAFDGAVQSSDNSVRSNAYQRGEALMQGYAQQGKSLVDRISNSGTTDRALTVGGLGAGFAGYMEPSVGLALGSIGLAYAPGARRILTGMMAPAESETRKAIGQGVRNMAPALGTGGAVLSLPER